MELVLIRHGHTVANAAHALDTAQPGAELTLLGRRQVAELADQLSAEPFDAIYCSSRTRAVRTAEALASRCHLTPAVRGGLAEIDAGDFEMSTAQEHHDVVNSTISAWIDGQTSAVIPGGESMDSTLARFTQVIEEIVRSGHQQVAVVSHGAILRLWCGIHLGNVSLQVAKNEQLVNAGFVRASLKGGVWLATEWSGRYVLPRKDSTAIA